MELTQQQADAFARMPLTYLRQEYPNHIMHLLNDDGDVLRYAFRLAHIRAQI